MRRGRLLLFCLAGWLGLWAAGVAAPDLLTPEERQWLDAHGPLRYAPDPHFAPFEFFRDDRQLAGISPEIMEKVARNLGTTIQPVRYVAWEDVLAGFQRGEADFLATLTRTPERERYLDYSAPYLSVPTVLIVNGADRRVNGFAELAGRPVGVVRNSGAHSWLLRHHPEVTIRPQANTRESLRKLSLGQLDAVLEVLPVAGFAIAQDSYTNLRVLPEVVLAIPQHLAVRKGETRLLAILEKGLASVSMEERLRIFSRWTGEDPAERRPSIPPWIWRVAAVLLLALAAVAVWVVSLRRLVGARTRELRASEAQFRLFLEELPVPASWAGADGRVEFVNREFTVRFGYTREDLPTIERWSELAYRDETYRREVDAQWRGHLQRPRKPGGFSDRLEVRMTCKNGQARTVMLAGVQVADKTLVVFDDISDRLRMEQQLRQAQKMEAIGQLAGGVAHDFNNLLTVIRGHCSLLLEESGLPATAGDSLAQIAEASDRAANLTRQLLTFSRQQAFRPRILDLRTCLESAGRLLARLIGEQIALEYRPGDAPVFVRADGGMIEQVIVNLAVNARDAMPAGGRLTIGVATLDIPAVEAGVRHPSARAGTFAVLTVADTGTGLAPEAMQHLFEPFFTTKDVGRGTGLGLATVYGIVQLHHGWIEVANQAGQGATFRLFFPAERDAPAAAAAAEPAPVHGAETILLVEDEPAVRALLKRSLEHFGYRVLEAENAAAALRVWSDRADAIDLLFTDMVMPGGMSGLELAGQLRRQRPALKVVIASGYSRRRDETDAGSGIDYLAKPFDVTTLAAAVRRSLDARGDAAG